MVFFSGPLPFKVRIWCLCSEIKSLIFIKHKMNSKKGFPQSSTDFLMLSNVCTKKHGADPFQGAVRQLFLALSQDLIFIIKGASSHDFSGNSWKILHNSFSFLLLFWCLVGRDSSFQHLKFIQNIGYPLPCGDRGWGGVTAHPHSSHLTPFPKWAGETYATA